MSERDAEEGMLNLAQGEFTYGTHTYTVQVSHHSVCVCVCVRVCACSLLLGNPNFKDPYFLA